mmetsp:Transcript_50465/g.121315  ORF Transcript_50465/g.121315 Transcript_50465/m.121315 type:complete len:204 (-) Transcript_50465:442-1053(-)
MGSRPSGSRHARAPRSQRPVAPTPAARHHRKRHATAARRTRSEPCPRAAGWATRRGARTRAAPPTTTRCAVPPWPWPARRSPRGASACSPCSHDAAPPPLRTRPPATARVPRPCPAPGPSRPQASRHARRARARARGWPPPCAWGRARSIAPRQSASRCLGAAPVAVRSSDAPPHRTRERRRAHRRRTCCCTRRTRRAPLRRG